MLIRNCKQVLFTSLLSQNLFHPRSMSFCTVSPTMCYYEVLNVLPTASFPEIKLAYYEKVKKYHPDHNTSSSAEECFKIVAKAYEVLRDPHLRKQYDAKRNPPTVSSHSTSSSHSHSSSRTTSTAYSSYESDFYNSYKNDHSYSSGNAYSYQNSWEAHNYREKDREAEGYVKYKTHSQRNQGFFDSLVVKIGMTVAVFFVIDMYKRTRAQQQQEPVKTAQAKIDPMSLGQVDFGRTLRWGRPMSQERLQEEMKKKGFRIEYQMAKTNVSPEAHKARKTYKKEKKIADLDSFMEKRNFTMEKSRAQ